MVYITDEEGTVRKFACLTCIKGHRSSGCQHSDRELMEIRKKGRPVSQCAHCRNLRKTKQVHIKCLCHKKSEVLSSLSMSSTPSPPRTSPTTAIVTPTTTFSPQSTSPGTSSDNHIIQQDLQVQNLLSKPCARCDRSPSYCICTFESRSSQADYGYLSSGSSDGTVTPPTTTTSISSPLANFDITSTSMPTTSSHTLRLVIPSNDSTTTPLQHPHHHLQHHMETSPSSSYDSIHSTNSSPRNESPFTTPNTINTPTRATTPNTGSLQQQRQHTSLSLSSSAGLQSIIPIHDPSDDLDSDTPVYKSEEQTIDQSAVLGELTNRTSEELMNQIYNEFSAETSQLSHPPVDFNTDEMDYEQQGQSSSRSSYQHPPSATSPPLWPPS